MAVCRVPSPTPASPHNQFLDAFDPQGSQSVRLTRDRLESFHFRPLLSFILASILALFSLSAFISVVLFNVGNIPTNFEIRRVKGEIMANSSSLDEFSLDETECQW